MKNQIHEVDAYCIGLVALGFEDMKSQSFNKSQSFDKLQSFGKSQSFANTYKIKQFRRQNRAVINHQTERSYYLNKKKVATNRKPRFEQSGDALSDWYTKQVNIYGRNDSDKMLSCLTVKKSSRSYNSKDRIMPGAVFVYNGQRHVMTGQLTGGRYLRAYGDIKTNYPVGKCQIIRNNEGLVFV